MNQLPIIYFIEKGSLCVMKIPGFKFFVQKYVNCKLETKYLIHEIIEQRRSFVAS